MMASPTTLGSMLLLLPALALGSGSGRGLEMEEQFQLEHEAEMRAAANDDSGNAPLKLVMLTDAQSKDKGAVCLDGTNPGLYMSEKGTGDGSNKWVL
jgi:hypothetical protein